MIAPSINPKQPQLPQTPNDFHYPALTVPPLRIVVNTPLLYLPPSSRFTARTNMTDQKGFCEQPSILWLHTPPLVCNVVSSPRRRRRGPGGWLTDVSATADESSNGTGLGGLLGNSEQHGSQSVAVGDGEVGSSPGREGFVRGVEIRIQQVADVFESVRVGHCVRVVAVAFKLVLKRSCCSSGRTDLIRVAHACCSGPGRVVEHVHSRQWKGREGVDEFRVDHARYFRVQQILTQDNRPSRSDEDPRRRDEVRVQLLPQAHLHRT